MRRSAVLLAVFAAGMVIGSLRTPMSARAQSGANDNRALVGFIPTRSIGASGVPVPSNCVDVSIVESSRRINSSTMTTEPGVVFLCERR